MKYEFWKDWKRKTLIEKHAIKSVILARTRIINSIPKNKLVAIYIKGSFVRREMKKGSDVDIVPIVTENKYEKKVFEVNTLEIHPSIVVPLSLWELENNKLYTKNNKPRAKPDRFVKKLDEYKIIYGKPLDVTKFKVRTDKECLKDLIKAFRKSFIPLYYKKKMGFSTLIKEVFWLTDLEESVKSKNPPHSFRGLEKTIKNKNHIIHDALKFRLKRNKDQKVRDKFIKKLKKHLTNLDKVVK